MFFDTISSITLNIGLGHIWDVANVATHIAAQTGKPVHFTFNELPLTAQPGSTPAEVCTTYDTLHNERYVARKRGL